MKTFIALLRGINVSGQKLIKMELLRKVLIELDFKNIKTYIQSGNVIFQSNETEPVDLEKKISALILKHFSFEVPVVVVTLSDLEFVADNNPFATQTMPGDTQPYVTFLSEKPAAFNMEVLKSIDFGADRLIDIDRYIFLWYAHGAGTTKLTNTIIENKLKVKATSRNWKTVHKLIEMAKAST
ncbi:DUF1697 domain-containing protein [Flavobacterium pallidum]|uniref:DUF1697 domain-containing protein n=1 Tax=Flavobacterium pallidum TaxID=2172098 RepID=A0A2S1SJH8_9FLAO|nr:DUF1697 domain-containing protein [Flavobacterium pallidum]AWI26499.1 DUF1697 domain-containing protein [Flavobacterium pallidum]